MNAAVDIYQRRYDLALKDERQTILQVGRVLATLGF
jgi:hypothetical protein